MIKFIYFIFLLGFVISSPTFQDLPTPSGLDGISCGSFYPIGKATSYLAFTEFGGFSVAETLDSPYVFTNHLPPTSQFSLNILPVCRPIDISSKMVQDEQPSNENSNSSLSLISKNDYFFGFSTSSIIYVHLSDLTQSVISQKGYYHAALWDTDQFYFARTDVKASSKVSIYAFNPKIALHDVVLLETIDISGASLSGASYGYPGFFVNMRHFNFEAYSFGICVNSGCGRFDFLKQGNTLTNTIQYKVNGTQFTSGQYFFQNNLLAFVGSQSIVEMPGQNTTLKNVKANSKSILYPSPVYGVKDSAKINMFGEMFLAIVDQVSKTLADSSLSLKAWNPTTKTFSDWKSSPLIDSLPGQFASSITYDHVSFNLHITTISNRDYPTQGQLIQLKIPQNGGNPTTDVKTKHGISTPRAFSSAVQFYKNDELPTPVLASFACPAAYFHIRSNLEVNYLGGDVTCDKFFPVSTTFDEHQTYFYALQTAFDPNLYPKIVQYSLEPNFPHPSPSLNPLKVKNSVSYQKGNEPSTQNYFDQHIVASVGLSSSNIYVITGSELVLYSPELKILANKNIHTTLFYQFNPNIVVHHAFVGPQVGSKDYMLYLVVSAESTTTKWHTFIASINLDLSDFKRVELQYSMSSVPTVSLSASKDSTTAVISSYNYAAKVLLSNPPVLADSISTPSSVVPTSFGVYDPNRCTAYEFLNHGGFRRYALTKEINPLKPSVFAPGLSGGILAEFDVSTEENLGGNLIAFPSPLSGFGPLNLKYVKNPIQKSNCPSSPWVQKRPEVIGHPISVGAIVAIVISCIIVLAGILYFLLPKKYLKSSHSRIASSTADSSFFDEEEPKSEPKSDLKKSDSKFSTYGSTGDSTALQNL